MLVGFGKYKDKSFLWVANNDPEFYSQIKKLYFKQYTKAQKQKYNYIFKKCFLDHTSTALPFKDKLPEVLDLLRQKKTSKEIRSILSESLPQSAIDSLMVDANAIIRKEFSLEMDYVLDIHIVRYDEIFNAHFNFEVEPHIPENYKNAILSEKYLIAMEALFQKEKLLGIHSKKFKLAQKPKITTRKDLDYNIKLLTLVEQIELLGLLNKAKNIEELVRPINNNTHLVSEQFIVEIKLIEQAPVKQVKETNVIDEERQKTIEKIGKTLDDVKEKINNNDSAKSLEDKIKEMYNKKNK